MADRKRSELQRMRDALRRIREQAAKVSSSDPATAYYSIGWIDAEAAQALGEAVFQGGSDG